ncbi:hypothetical protein VR010_14115 [Actinomycetaceae bacterium L2_0104]
MSRYEAERSAWIKNRRWLDKPAAARRAEKLARTARRLDRAETGLGDSLQTEAETKGVFHRWTSHEDSATSAMGFIAFIIVYVLTIPFWFGVTWLVGRGSFKLAEWRGRVRIALFAVLAVIAAVLVYVSRIWGWDLEAIYFLAWCLEKATGGWIGPLVLSGWYAAGIISWLKIQIALGFVYAGYLTYAWGWTAPAVRRAAKAGNTSDKGLKIIPGAGSTIAPDAPLPTVPDEAAETDIAAEDAPPEAEPVGIKIIDIPPMDNEEEE